MNIVQVLDLAGAPAVRELPRALEAHDRVRGVVVGFDSFWSGRPGDTDILHIHWPESLVQWREPSSDDLRRIRSRIAAWSSEARIVATIHNRHPHYRDTAAFRRLYEIIYNAVDGVIHMGHASVKDMAVRYPRLGGVPRAMIPLGLPPFEPNLSRSKAKEMLGIPSGAVSIVSLCRIRDPSETRLLLSGFDRLRCRSKRLIFAGRLVLSDQWNRRLHERLRLRFDPRIITAFGQVPDRDVPRYLGAGDIFVIPRNEILNSGGIATGFFFGQVVVGPATGVVGEVLEQTENPTFTPGDRGSLGSALQIALALSASGKGEVNRQYALDNWNWKRLAHMHLEFYEKVVARETSNTHDL